MQSGLRGLGRARLWKPGQSTCSLLLNLVSATENKQNNLCQPRVKISDSYFKTVTFGKNDLKVDLKRIYFQILSHTSVLCIVNISHLIWDLKVKFVSLKLHLKFSRFHFCGSDVPFFQDDHKMCDIFKERIVMSCLVRDIL